MTIKINNVGRRVTADSLAAVFSTYGHVSFSTILAAESAGSNSKAAVVNMPDETEAARAIKGLNGCYVDGYALLVTSTVEAKASPKFSYYRWVRNLFPRN